MPRSTGGSIAAGIESGFRLGQGVDEAKERERSSARADAHLALQQESVRDSTRQRNLTSNLDLLDRKQKILTTRQGEIEALSTAAQTGGSPVDPDLANEYGRNAEELARVRQNALDFFSRAQTGQINPMDASPKELYTNLVAATGMSVPEMQQAPKFISDVTAGLETGNKGLLVQGVNGLMAPKLRRGVGSPSPHGGTITRKEIIGLDPAVDNAGNPLPGKFMPRLRVYVKSDSGEGGEKYYDAPMTVDGSGDNDDRVAVIDVKNAMNWMGNLGTLTTALGRPEIAEKLAQGEKEAGPDTKKYLDALTAISRPKPPKGAAAEKLETIRRYAKEKGVTDDQAAEQLQGMGVLANMGALNQQLAAIDDLGITDEEKVKLKRDVILKSGGKTTGLIPQKPGKGGGGAGSGAESEGLSKKYTSNKGYAQQVDFWADVLSKGGTLPPRFAQSGAGKEMFSDIVQRVPDISGGANDMLSNQSEFGGLKAGARTVGTRSANFGLAKEEAYEMADLVASTSAKVNRTSFAPINRAINAFNTNTGDTGIREFGAALNSFINAYARAVSPVGTPTVSDKEHAREMLSTADSHQQVQAIIGQLKREMEAAGRAPKTVRQQQRDAAQELGSGGRGQPAAGTSKSAGQFEVGKTYVDGKGRKATYQADGTWKAVQ